MSLSTSIRNVKIRNNSIDIGFSSNAISVSNYTYISFIIIKYRWL